LTPGLIEPGKLPSGKYETRYFFAGQMTFSFAKGWYSGEDSTGEFAAWPQKTPNAKVIFWEDIYPVKVSPGFWLPVGPLRRTSASLLTSLQRNPNLTVSKPKAGRIGSIRARVVDVGIAHAAVNDDPSCPAKTCANFVQFPQWDAPYGIAARRSVASISPMYATAVSSICSWPLSRP
jgi:hypothetical protein